MQAANLNDSFFDLLLEIILDIGVLCRGPVKRPDRGLQAITTETNELNLLIKPVIFH
jgi:hypothetical protein